MPLLACNPRARACALDALPGDGGQMPVFLSRLLAGCAVGICLFAPMLAPGQGFRFKVA